MTLPNKADKAFPQSLKHRAQTEISIKMWNIFRFWSVMWKCEIRAEIEKKGQKLLVIKGHIVLYLFCVMLVRQSILNTLQFVHVTKLNVNLIFIFLNPHHILCLSQLAIFRHILNIVNKLVNKTHIDPTHSLFVFTS